MKTDNLMTVKDAAKKLQISYGMLYAAIWRGNLECTDLFGKKLLNPEQFKEAREYVARSTRMKLVK